MRRHLRRVATRVAHRDRHPHRALRRVVAGDGVVEEDHEAVASEALECSLEAVDEVAQRAVVVGEHGHDLLGLHGLGERREPAEVAEHHGDLAAVALEKRLVARGDDQLDQLRREEPLQPADPFELLDLLAYALLECLVPLRKLGRLGSMVS